MDNGTTWMGRSEEHAEVRADLVARGIAADGLARLDRAMEEFRKAERAFIQAREGDRLSRGYFAASRVLGAAGHAYDRVMWDEQRAADFRAGFVS